MNILRKQQKKDLYKELRPVVAFELRRWKEVKQWTYTEIARACNLPLPRITEMVNFKRYEGKKDVLNEPNMIALIAGGVMTIQKAKDAIVQTPEKLQYLDSLKIHEDKRLREIYNALLNKGITPDQIHNTLTDKFEL